MSSKQACRLCRSRKIKCDNLPTCSNCHRSQATCEYSIPRKRGPKPGRWRKPPSTGSHCPASPTSTSSAGAASPLLTRDLSQERQAYHSASSTIPSLLPSGDTIAVTANPLIDTPVVQLERAVAIQFGLLSGLLATAPLASGASIANHCIHLYTRYVFGAFPLCHEATLRATVTRFFVPLSGAEDQYADRELVSRCFAADSEQQRIGALRSLTLLTALCAAVAYVVPKSLMTNKDLVAPLFLRASRETLRVFEDYDLEYPDSSSLNIRHFFSSAVQSATGMYGAASHILNQAGLLAMKMRLYDESSLEGFDPIEEKLLRNTFWQLYVCDQTALIMKDRPVTIHESLFETDFTTKTQSSCSVPLLLHDGCSQGARLEECLAEGFHVICRLWTMAARVIHDMERLSKRRTQDALIDDRDRCETIERLSGAYFEGITLTSEFLAHGVLPEGSSPASDVEMDHQLLDILQRQRTSYLITLYSIKFFVLKTAISSDMTNILGLNAEPLTLAMKQIELAQEFLLVLESVPFVHLQTEGEHCSAKIRRVGSLLLEIAQGPTTDTIKGRANDCTMRLVNLLARLDSKASDALGQQMNH